MGTAQDAGTGRIGQLIRYMQFLTTFYRNQPQTHYFRMLQDYFVALRDARQNGDFVVAHTIFFPVEIFDALDLVPVHLEFTGSLMSAFGIDCGDLLAGAAEMGLPPEVCSAHRVIAGALKAGAMPEADAVVCSNLVCDNAMKTGELTMSFHACPGFIFDYPFSRSEAADVAVMQELKEVIAFLESVSGHKIDWDRLSANISETNRQIELVREINNLCKAVPSPMQPQDFLKLLVVDYMGAGKPQTTFYLQSLRDDLAAKVADGKGFAGQERLRLMATMISPWYLQGTIDNILSEHGASVVCNVNPVTGDSPCSSIRRSRWKA